MADSTEVKTLLSILYTFRVSQLNVSELLSGVGCKGQDSEILGVASGICYLTYIKNNAWLKYMHLHKIRHKLVKKFNDRD